MKLRAACIQTHNAPAMVEFYTKAFGHEPFVDGGVDFQFREEQLTVFKLEEAEERPCRDVALVYVVEDVDTEFKRLDALGLCNGTQPTDKPWGVRSFFFYDPDGNMLSFLKDLP